MSLGEVVGLEHPNGELCMEVELIGVTADTFIVRDGDTSEEMIFSRATGHRRDPRPSNWEYWHLPAEDLRVLNGTMWKV